MKILFSNGTVADIMLLPVPMAEVCQTIYKHLSHVMIPFSDWENPYYLENIDYYEVVDKLILYGNKLSIKVDQNLCLARDQNYLNTIHKIYENNYNGNPDWLNFHEHIHLCETRTLAQRRKVLCIDYGEKAGLLEKPLDFKWIDNSTTKIKAGDVFVKWAELGKIPYIYWDDNESDDFSRLCELAKPWLKLKPQIHIALEDIDTLENIKQEEFNLWWKDRSQPWCQHWDIPSWTLHDMYSVSVFGKVSNVETIIQQLTNQVKPSKVLL
jgi:hypothetical protein